MSALEQIIRPFQRPDALSTKRLIATNEKIEVTPAVRSWGRAGPQVSAEQLEDPPPLVASFRVVTERSTYFEAKRETKTVRIENPEDSAQYVDVERIKRIDFSKRNGTRYPDGNEVDITGKYSVAYREIPVSGGMSQVTYDRREQDINYVLNDE